jgi:glycosyltransferase involved in cell wall biosynthesis
MVTSPPGPAVSVVMPCHDRAAILGRTLAAWEAQQGDAPFEVIAVDDGSQDGTADLLAAFLPRRFSKRVVRLGRSHGPAHARNLGIAEARAPLLLLVGDDIVPASGFLAAHLDVHAAHPEPACAVLGHTAWPGDLPVNSLMRHIDAVGAQQFSYHNMRDGQVMDYRHFYTSNISVKAALLAGVDPLFDTSFRHPAYEDIELAYRLAKERGLQILYSARPLATHYHYYSARAFAARQVRCGAMSARFVEKHPELSRTWRFERVDACVALGRDPRLAPLVAEGNDAPWAVIEEASLALAGHCEAVEGPAVDRFYLTLLEYFVVKGMIDGKASPGDAVPAARALAVVALGPSAAEIAADLAATLPPDTAETIASLQRTAAACEDTFRRTRLTRDRHWRAVRYHAVTVA